MKKIYLLPNLFTTANMFCGFMSMVSSIHGNFTQAAWLIVASMVFDSMDGRIARLIRATSAFGVQYDSLSDLMSFGITPAFLIYMWGLEPFGRLGIVVSFFYIVCAALRLARFNLLADSGPKNFFQGLPSPLAAVTIGASFLFYTELNLDFPKEKLLFPLMISIALLMVSSFHFYSFKNLKMKKEAQVFTILFFLIFGLGFLAIRPEVHLFVMCLIYILIGLGWSCWEKIARKKNETIPSK